MKPLLTEFTDSYGKKISFYKYRSFYDFVNDVKRTPQGVSHSNLSSRSTGRNGFYGTATWDDAIKLIDFGWPEGLKKFKEVFSDLDINLGRLKDNFSLEWDVAGDMVDVGAYCAGSPEHMIKFPVDQSVGKGKIIEIAIDICAHCDVDTDVFHRRGAIISVLTEYFILNGYGVEVLGYYGVSYHGQIGALGVPIYRAGEIFDMDRLIFCTANASFFRRLAFSFMELHLGINLATCPSYGHPFHDFPIKSDIVFGGYWYDHCDNDKKAKNYILSCVESFNRRESIESLK